MALVTLVLFDIEGLKVWPSYVCLHPPLLLDFFLNNNNNNNNNNRVFIYLKNESTFWKLKIFIKLFED